MGAAGDTATATAADLDPGPRIPRPGRRGPRDPWIEQWDPDDEVFWETTGRRIAKKNLSLSMFSEHIAFGVWVVWTIVVLNLVHAGIKMSVSELFELTLVPNLIGSVLRIPYTLAVLRLGGRAWTVISASLLAVPALLLALVVPSAWLAHQAHGTQFWVLLACAATAGVGGGNFASSMTNISFFYPEKEKGWALGLNAAGGNLGVATAQLLVPLVLIVGVPSALVKLTAHPVHLAYAGWIWVPLLVAGGAAAWLWMDSIGHSRGEATSYLEALRYRHTWIISLLYIGTFGSFIGMSFALPLVIKNTFPEFLAGHPFIATYLAGLGFLGALTGSLSRPVGGWLADRVGGARVTVAVFAGMGAFTMVAIVAVDHRSFALFLGSYIVVFVLTGMGNGSVYKMIPSIFATIGRSVAAGRGLVAGSAGAKASAVEFKRRAAAVIGIAGAFGAFGGVLVQVVLRQASLGISALEKAARTPADKVAIAAAHSAWSVPALWIFVSAYVVLGGLAWAVYVRPGGERMSGQ